MISFAESMLIDWTISKPDGTEEGNYIGKFLDDYQAAQKTGVAAQPKALPPPPMPAGMVAVPAGKS